MANEFQVQDSGEFLQAAQIHDGFKLGIGVSDDNFEPAILFQFQFSHTQSDEGERRFHALSFTVEQATCLRDMLNFAIEPGTLPEPVERPEPETVTMRCERVTDIPEPAREAKLEICDRCHAEVWIPVRLQAELRERYPDTAIEYRCGPCVRPADATERPMMSRGQVADLRAAGVDDHEIACLLAMVSTVGVNAEMQALDDFAERMADDPELTQRFWTELAWAEAVIASGGE